MPRTEAVRDRRHLRGIASLLPVGERSGLSEALSAYLRAIAGPAWKTLAMRGHQIANAVVVPTSTS